MPRVASEAHNVLPSRPHQPANRSQSDADSRSSASPFSDMLDSAAPQANPAPPSRQARTERPERADRADKPKSSDDRSADTKPAKDSADATDAKTTDDAKAAEDGKKADSGKDTKTDTAAGSTDGKTKPEPDADKAAALDAMFVDPAVAAVTSPQPTAAAIVPVLTLDAAPAEGGTASEDALALAAAGQDVAKAAAPKPAPAQNGKPGDASAKDANAADPQAAKPAVEAAKDSQSRGHEDKAAGSFHRAAAEAIARLDADKPAQDSGAATAKAGTDAVQNAGTLTPGTTSSTAATAAANAPAQTQAPAAAVPLSGLAVEIASQASAGKQHFEIRLDPADLGRIDVKLDIDRDGNVSTKLVVDRADTLDLLKRDASTLERALQQAGLKTSDHGLDFSLRQHAFTQDDTGAQNGARVIVSDDNTAPLEALRQGYGRLLGLGGGLDIRI